MMLAVCQGLRLVILRVFCTAGMLCTPKYFGVRFCGYCQYSRQLERMLPILAVFWGFCTADAAKTDSIWLIVLSRGAFAVLRDTLKAPSILEEYQKHTISMGVVHHC